MINREEIKIKKQLATNEKERIIDLHDRGYKIIDIADIYQINECTVRRIIKKEEILHTVERKEGTGKNIKYEKIEEILISMIKNNRGLTLNEIKNKLKEDYKINYSKANIHYILKKIGYVKKRAILKIPLSEQQLNDREFWGIYHNGFNWDNIIWSDETKICNDSNSKQKIWIQSDENIIKCKYRYPLKINIWGAITKNKKLIFKIFDKTENSDEYLKILEEHLLPLYKKNKNYIFQQDNAPCHTSLKTISFFSKHKIEVMYWPPNSPDLNPIENVWNLVKNDVRKKHYNSKEEMITETTKILYNFPIESINNLIDSMDKRVNALFDNNFNIINY